MKKIYTLLLLIPAFSAFSQIEGNWQMAPKDSAFIVGPERGSGDWWANSTADVTGRACFFDDEFVFDSNGTFTNVMGADTWLETWQDGVATEACGVPVAPHDGSNSATWSYDSANSTITLIGAGAHLGIPKAINEYELSDSLIAVPDSIVYKVELSSDSSVMYADILVRDSLLISTEGEEGWWRFILCRDGNCGVDDIVVVLDTTGGGDTIVDPIDTMSLGNNVIFRNLVLAPNPARNILILSYSSLNTGRTELIIYDNLGKEIKSLNYLTKQGENFIKVDISNFNKGIYYIKTISNNEISVNKFIKE